MLGSKKPGWRPFVLVSLLIVLAMVVTGCKKDTPEPGAVEDTAVPAADTAVPAEDPAVPMVSEFSEGPMLAGRAIASQSSRHGAIRFGR